MKITLIAQDFSPFQLISIHTEFDLKNIRLFSISMNFLFHFFYILYVGCDLKNTLVQM